ncbi:CHAP domain-containing protein [Bengtsoniella intestinalis]|uniref:CHAP domain-containing protein n=1 Tax=Bengtsoniella intestinalis TaxID=3073143 RepID=UPI00391EED92
MTKEKLLSLAQYELGVMESPAGSNRVKYNTAYYGGEVSGAQYPWCCVFLWWLFDQCEAKELFYGGGKTASCGALARYGQANNQYVTDDYHVGDLVFFHFGGSTIVHIGIVEQVRESGALVTIEGNTGTASEDNGGCVMRRVRPLSYVAGAYRPHYDEEEEPVTYRLLSDIPEAFRGVMELLIEAGILQGTHTDVETQSPVLDVTHTQVRTLVLVYRGGGFDAKLVQEGLPPAVPVAE